MSRRRYVYPNTYLSTPLEQSNEQWIQDYVSAESRFSVLCSATQSEKQDGGDPGTHLSAGTGLVLSALRAQ